MMNIGFEIDSDYEMGIAGLDKMVRFPDYKVIDIPPYYWDRGGYIVEVGCPGGTCIAFEPETAIVHSGSRSALVHMKSPVSEATKRLEIMRDLDPLNDIVLDMEMWYYFPSATMPFNETGRQTALHRILYERMWRDDLPNTYQSFNVGISAYLDNRGATKDQLMFLLFKQDYTDNDDDGIDENVNWNAYSNGGVMGSDPSGLNLEAINHVLVPFDRWFKIRNHIVRDFVNGVIQVWIDTGDGAGEKLIWDLRGDEAHPFKTIGINPQRLADSKLANGANSAWLSVGFSLYYGIGQPDRTMFVDDFSLTTRKTELSMIPLATAIAIGAGATYLLYRASKK